MDMRVAQVLAIFCRVNIDDELYVQHDKSNTCAELVLEEFEEVGRALTTPT